MPVIILGGIVAGVTTPTEAGVVAVLYAIGVGRFLYRELTWRQIARITQESMINSGLILLTIAAAGIFSWLVANLAIGETLAKTLLALTDDTWAMLALINIVLLLWGLALEPAVALVTLVPVLVPIANAYHIDLVHLGVDRGAQPDDRPAHAALRRHHLPDRPARRRAAERGIPRGPALHDRADRGAAAGDLRARCCRCGCHRC